MEASRAGRSEVPARETDTVAFVKVNVSMLVDTEDRFRCSTLSLSTLLRVLDRARSRSHDGWRAPLNDCGYRRPYAT